MLAHILVDRTIRRHLGPPPRLTRRQLLAAGAASAACAPLAIAEAATASGRFIPNVVSLQPLSIAIPDLVAANTAVGTIAAEMTESIRRLLAYSGPVSIRDDIRDAGDPGFDTPPRFSFWRSHGVDVLVAGRIDVLEDHRLQTKFRLWGIAAGGQLIGRSYRAPIEDWPCVGRVIAADIFKRLEDVLVPIPVDARPVPGR